MDTRVTHITTTYTACDTFEIPDDVFLLGKEENEKAKVSDYGAWYIRYSTLYYIDKDGKERTIEGEQGGDDDDGVPDDIETEERCVTPEDEECGICEHFGTRNAVNLCKRCAKCPECKNTRTLASSESREDVYRCTDGCSQNNITKQHAGS
jgi:hypothetical protein